MFKLTRDPATPPVAIVDLAIAKKHLRIEDFADDDSLVQLYLDVAHAYLEGPQGVAGSLSFGPSRWTYITGRPWNNLLALPIRPLVSVEKVETLQAVSGGVFTWTEWPVEQWRVSWMRDIGTIVPNVNFFWPVTVPRDDVVRVSFTAGSDSAAAAPRPLQLAILLHVAHMYEHREAVAHGQQLQDLPMGYDALIAPYRSGQS